MTRFVGRCFLMSLALSLSVAARADALPPVQSDASLHAQLQRVAGMRIYWGHQSVGANVLDGLKLVADKSGVPVHIVESTSAQAVPPASFGHTFVAENRNPLGKLQAFDTAMGVQPSGVDIAMVKFCYVDFEANTDVKALFARYQDTVKRVQARNPQLKIVHITTPLTTVQTGPKAFLKSLLGTPPYGALENQRREEYNALLRQAYEGKEPFFDLARLEYTAPDGTASTYAWKGTAIPVLTAAYTEDGGHLNTQGQMLAARQFVGVLAAAAAH